MTTGEYLIKNVQEQIKKTGNPYEDLRNNTQKEKEACESQIPVHKVKTGMEGEPSSEHYPKIELYGFPRKQKIKKKKISFIGKIPKRERK